MKILKMKRFLFFFYTFFQPCVKRYTSCILHLEFEFMFKECEEQKTGPTHQQAEVLQEEHETRPVGLHSTHLWKLKKETEQISFDRNVSLTDQ